MNPANSLLRRQQQDKKNQTITVIKHFDPRNTNRLLSDSLPELNIDMENFMNKNIKVGTVKKSKIKPNKNNNPPDNDNNIKMTNDKNSIELSTNKAKKTNYKKDKKTPTTKRNKVNSKIDDESKSLKNERIETNLTNIDKGSKIRLSIKPKKCKKPPKKTDEETNLKTYRSLKELHKEISNSRKTLKRSRTVNADTGAKTDDYVEGLKKEITKNRVKSKKKSCDIIEKLKKEIEEYRKNKQNGAVAAMSPEAVIDKADTNLQTEEASAPVDETTTTKGMNNRDEFNKRIESQIRETQNLMVEVRTTLQDMKEVLNLKKRVPQTRDCGTTPPPSPAKSVDKQTNLEDNQIKIERILEVIQEVSERISVKASEISVVHRASSPIMDSPTIVAKPTISETKLFQDQANQSDESLVTILPPKVTEDKCLETDFINLQIVEEMTNHCGLSIIDDIIYEDSDEDDEEMVEKPRQLTIQQLPSININRGLVVQTALKLDIEPTKPIDNGDQITNIGYKEFNKVEEQKLERSSPIPVDKIEEIATKSASCIDKDVQVSDLESVSSEFPLDVIEFVKKKYTDFVWVLNDNLDGDNEIELQISLDNTSKNSTPREELQKTIDLYSSQAIQCNLSANDYTDDEFEDEEIPVKDVSSSESQSTQNQTKFESFNPVDSEGDIIRIKRERELFNTTLIIPLREYQLLDLSNSESASMGEIYYNQCACSNVSIGEVHDCNYGIIQNALDIQKQKAIYRNWISYCLSRNVKIDDSSLSS